MTPVLNPTQRISAVWGVLQARQSAGTHIDQELRPAAEQMASDRAALRSCGMSEAEIDAFFAPAPGRKAGSEAPPKSPAQSVGTEAVAAWKDFEARRVAPYMARIKSSGLPAETAAHLLRQSSGQIEATLARIEAGGAK